MQLDRLINIVQLFPLYTIYEILFIYAQLFMSNKRYICYLHIFFVIFPTTCSNASGGTLAFEGAVPTGGSCKVLHS